MLVPVAPLSNIAACIALDPKFVSRVPEIVIMGGAHALGNVTPSAEFNIWVDPEAARIVLLSGLPVELVGWQLSRYEAVLNADDIAEVLALSTPLADFAIRCNGRAREAYLEQTGEHGISLPDPVAMRGDPPDQAGARRSQRPAVDRSRDQRRSVPSPESRPVRFAASPRAGSALSPRATARG